MNFLAHIYLSYGHEKLMLGNFIGDFVKGNQLQDFEEGIKKGIILHRLIDEYTDKHEIVQQSKNRLRPKYRHYSGVIVDVYYDHFLSKDWLKYHDTPLKEFTITTYNQIKKYETVLPKGAAYMLPYMMKNNWLLNYGEIEGISKALNGMSRRTTFDSKMNESIAELEHYYSEFQREFDDFFIDLRSFAKGWIASEMN